MSQKKFFTVILFNFGAENRNQRRLKYEELI